MAISKGLNPVLLLVGVVVALLVLAIFAGMAILGTQNSANLNSAIITLSQTLPIIGIGIFVGLITLALRSSKG